MKREIFAAVLLVVMLVCSIINTNQISALTTSVEASVEKAALAAKDDKWTEGLKHAQEAFDIWEKSSKYTEIVLRHEKTETTTDKIYDLIRDLQSKNKLNTSITADKLKDMLQNIRSMESIKLTSIF